MTHSYLLSAEYKDFIVSIKHSISQAKSKAIRSVNAELINLYYQIGKQILEKQKNSSWGEDLIGQIEKDLKVAFPDLAGFSRRNINSMRSFYNFVQDDKIMQQLVAQIPWGHFLLIIRRVKDKNEARFYIQKTIENSWSRVILDHQISLNLYNRQGKLVTNFEATIENTDIKLIQESFK